MRKAQRFDIVALTRVTLVLIKKCRGDALVRTIT